MKSTAVRRIQNQSAEVIRLPVKVAGDLRRSVDSAYGDLSRSVRRAKNVTDDLIYDSRHQIKRHPLAAVGSATLAGLAIGFIAGWRAASKRNRR